MSLHLSRSVFALLPALALLAGCDVPNVPLDGPLGGSTAPTITGSLKADTTTSMRVGLLGAKSAGQPKREIASTTVGAGGSYSLQFPSSPPYDLMVNETESALFSLSAYKDLNNNGRYDTTDELTEAAASSGNFRFFTEDGAPGGHKAGWNLFQNGVYTQSFNTAFVLQSL